MTAVLSYVNKYFSIILSDNRVSYGLNQEGGYEDGHIKLINLRNMGWASGAGFADYLEKFKKALAINKIRSVGDIETIFKDVLESFKKEKPVWQKEIDSSVAVASWIGSSNGLNMFFRIGILSNEHFGIGIKVLNNGSLNILYPGDYLTDTSKVDSIETKYSLEIGEKDFQFVLEHMLNIFKEISITSNQVSSTCDIGVHKIAEDEIYKLKISGEVDELIKALERGSIEELTETIR